MAADPVAFFLNSNTRAAEFETLEISHPSFSKVYYVVRNAIGGITATTETGASRFWEYYPLRIARSGVRSDLDQSISVTLGDLGEMIPDELDRCRAAGTMNVYPSVTYRTFSSLDLTGPMNGPVKLLLMDISRNDEGASFDAQAPTVSSSRTGEIYTIDRFPTLRGLL